MITTINRLSVFVRFPWNLKMIPVYEFYISYEIMIGSIVHTPSSPASLWEFTQFKLCPVGPLRDQGSLTRVCLKCTAFIPWALIPLSTALLSVLCSVCVCHPKLLWTRWIRKNKAIAQNQCSLEYRSHCALSKGNVEITLNFLQYSVSLLFLLLSFYNILCCITWCDIVSKGVVCLQNIFCFFNDLCFTKVLRANFYH